MIPQSDPGAFAKAHRKELLEAMARVVDSGWYVLGTEVATFEAEFAQACGLGAAVGVANGTDALALALRALGLGAGARVATVSHTAVATVAAIEMAGAAPVFVDIDPKTYTIDPAALAALIERGNIAAVVAVHLYGQPVDPAVFAIAGAAGIPVIEDCAQAQGAKIGLRQVGGLGTAGAFSFYPTKNLGALGDGGLVCADAATAERLKALRQYGWNAARVSEVPGVNSRLDELQAAILRVKLRHLEAGNARRREIARAYSAGLERSGLTLPASVPGTVPVFHQYVIRHADRDGLMARLKARGIGTGIHYAVPVHAMPAYRDRCELAGGLEHTALEHTERAAREILSLPMYPELTETQVAEVIDGVLRSL